MISRHEIHTSIQESLREILPALLTEILTKQQQLDELPRYLTQRQAADILGCSTSKIKQLLNVGALTPKYIKGITHRRLCKEEVQDLLVQRIQKK